MSWRLQPQRLVDLLLCALCVLYGVAERALTDGTDWSDLAVVLAVTAGPVAVQSTWPVPAAVVSTGGLAFSGVLGLGVDESFAAALGPVLTSYTLGRVVSPLAMAVVALGGAAALFAAAGLPDSALGSDDTAITVAAMLVAVGVGRASREMQLETDVLRAQRDVEVRTATEQERLRIARELHDVLGHTVSVMGIQAAAVRRRLLPEQRTERDALEAVELAGREAVGELRRLLGLLRAPDALPESGALGSAARLLAVVDDVRRSGVDVQVDGAELVDRLPPAVATTVVRVVQEGLTNVLRHAPGAAAVVRLADDRSGVLVSVTDDGPGTAPGRSGFGLVGMRERLTVFGGSLSAGPGPEGGFVLEARLPAGAS